MLRFPNPGSTLANFVAVYTASYEALHGQIVSLDDIVHATIKANLATSSGHMGDKAISRSTRPDRSRDPLYNQIKMYSELFRVLGWLRSTETSALSYTFTLLGAQVVAAERQWKPLVEECVLGIAYPSHVLKVRGNHDIRPFATILRTMLACNGMLSRDEMILGPLSASSDRRASDLDSLAKMAIDLREEPNVISNALIKLEQERGIALTTLRNYTRWPLAILRDLGWTQKTRVNYRTGKKTFEVHQLTPKGEQRARSIEAMIDLRIDQIDILENDQKNALSQHAHFEMMQRAEFDLTSVTEHLRQTKKNRTNAMHQLGLPDDKPVLFSPFQALSISDSTEIFPTTNAITKGRSGRTTRTIIGGMDLGRGTRAHLFVSPNFVASDVHTEGVDLRTIKAELESFRVAHSSIDQASLAFAQSRRTNTQTQFYPLVTQLLQLLGFRSECSRPGVNYQRWDACVWLHDLAVPIEIKSPTEEEFLSTKAIRQAIENKVILLARGGLKTNRELPTLIVGYKIPNERGDMSTLIDDVHAAFGFNIGVIDLNTLAYLAMKAVNESVSIDENQLSDLKGFYNV